MSRIRRHFAFFGCDLSHLSDEEIIAGFQRAGQVIAQVGLTTDQAIAALEALSAAARTAEQGGGR